MCRDPRNSERISRMLREEFPDLPDEELRRITRALYVALFGIV